MWLFKSRFLMILVGSLFGAGLIFGAVKYIEGRGADKIRQEIRKEETKVEERINDATNDATDNVNDALEFLRNR